MVVVRVTMVSSSVRSFVVVVAKAMAMTRMATAMVTMVDVMDSKETMHVVEGCVMDDDVRMVSWP